ncbi:cilia- and flagella-associated protein 46-like [Oryzias latipes]|uniref:cilia- and flagella-associated protein 46-like n=1 Tax=Oryzias latipes TaxID=8090 RepID=UPI0005CBB620|nr:cilia- and flagella-associated protein 46-like [Oryzias latipes]
MDLDIRQHLIEAQQNRDPAALQAAFRSLTSAGAAAELRGRIPRVPADLYVVCAEVALQLGCVDTSTECLKTYFNGNPPPSQFLSRAFLCQGQLQPLPIAGSVVRTVTQTHSTEVLRGLIPSQRLNKDQTAPASSHKRNGTDPLSPP